MQTVRILTTLGLLRMMKYVTPTANLKVSRNLCSLLVLFNVINCLGFTFKSFRRLQTSLSLTNSAEIVTDLDVIASSWALKKYGQNIVLECTNKNLDEDIVSGNVSLRGLGLEFVELAIIPDSQYALTSIARIIPGGSAEKSGVFSVGDVLISITEPAHATSSLEEKSVQTSSLEALNFYATISEMLHYIGHDEVTITARRLIKRKTINIEVYDPQGKFTGSTLITQY